MIDWLRNWQHNRKHKQDYEKKWPELPVKHLVYFDDDPVRGTVIVFIDFACDLDYQRDDVGDKFAADNGHDALVSKMWNSVSALEPYVQNWPKDLRLSAKRALGECLARALSYDAQNAKDAIRRAKSFIKQKSQEVSRFWTLKAAATGSALCVLVAAVAIYHRAAVTRWFGETPYVLSIAFSAGTMGALLSIILRLGKVTFDASAEKRLHYAEGIARIIAGGIAGILLGALVRLGILLPVFMQTRMVTTAVCCVAIVAGASERWVPAIIGKFESNDVLLDEGES